jgi:uncharacterized protein (DUF1800 family)
MTDFEQAEREAFHGMLLHTVQLWEGYSPSDIMEAAQALASKAVVREASINGNIDARSMAYGLTRYASRLHDGYDRECAACGV